MGRKPLHQSNQNIEVAEKLTAGWKVGNCKICLKKGIRSNRWSEHLHENYETDLGAEINNRFIEDAMMSLEKSLQQNLWVYLVEHQSLGISNDEGQRFLDYLKKGIADLISFYSKPHKKSKSKKRMKEEMSSIPQEYKEDQIEYPKPQPEPVAFSKTRKGKIIKKEKRSQHTMKSRIDQDFNIEKYLRKQHISSPRISTLRQLIGQYQAGQINVENFKNGFKKGQDGDCALYNLLKVCFVCDIQFKQRQFTFHECNWCHTCFHDGCLNKLELCVCDSVRPRQRQRNELLLSMNYGPPRGVAQQFLLNELEPNIITFNYSTLYHKVKAEERALIQQLKERDHLVYTRFAVAPKDIYSMTNAITDPLITYASPKFKEAYRDYQCGNYLAPVKLIYLEALGLQERHEVGVQAIDDIPKSALICEYATDILPSAYLPQIKLNEHVMFYANGKDGLSELVLAPFNYSNWSIFINHAPRSKSNCSSLRIVIDSIIRVIIYANRKISKGEQLLYNYNGFFEQVNTSSYRDLQKLQ